MKYLEKEKRNFETKIMFQEENGKGEIKDVKVNIFIQGSVNFAESESRTQDYNPDGVVIATKHSKVIEVIRSGSSIEGKWFFAKLNFIALDEKSGLEKKTKVVFLVESESVKHADSIVKEHMKSYMCDYEIEGITESKITSIL